MYPRSNYEMTENDLKELLDSCKPTIAMLIGNYSPSSPQENANRAWKALGVKMGFDYETVRPIEGKGQRFFSAIPSETESQKNERLAKESEEKRLIKIKQLKAEIADKQNQLAEII